MAKSKLPHSQPAKKRKVVRYRVQNWPQYERALRQRSNIQLWLDPELFKRWPRREQPHGRRGAPCYYSPAVIVCMLTLKALYHLSHRDVEGFVRSLLHAQHLRRRVPDHTTLSRRGRHVAVDLDVRPSHQPVHVLLDSSGVQIRGVSPWREWQHQQWRRAQAGRQDFRKIHVAFNADTHEFLAVEVTDKYEHDQNLVPALLDAIAAPLAHVTADGNYDFHFARNAIAAHGAAALIPPRADAVVDPRPPRPERDAAVRWIQTHATGRKGWKKRSGYHRRSLVETAFSRWKGRLGTRLASREKLRQITEVRIGCRLLNRFIHLGRPETARILPT